MKEKTQKKSIWLDFDGVIHSYQSGWHGADIIIDLPNQGAIEAIRIYLKHFHVMIFSSRNASNQGVIAMQQWLIKNGLTPEEVSQIHFPKDKPAAYVGIDDRVLNFNGNFPTVTDLLNFKTHHQ